MTCKDRKRLDCALMCCEISVLQKKRKEIKIVCQRYYKIPHTDFYMAWKRNVIYSHWIVKLGEKTAPSDCDGQWAQY